MYIEHYAQILEEVLTFFICRTIKQYFKSFDDYKLCVESFYNGNNKSLCRLTLLFHFDSDFYNLALGCTHINIDGKRYRILKDVKKRLNEKSKMLKLIGKKDIKYMKSGKKFSHPSLVLLRLDAIKQLTSNEDIFDAKSEHYCDDARNHIFNILERPIMTKKQKEQYEKEYREGKHMLTLKEYEADQRKKKRRADKHKLTLMKKAQRAIDDENAKMREKIDALEAEVARLKQLKDINSDIPDEDANAIVVKTSDLPAAWRKPRPPVEDDDAALDALVDDIEI